MAEAVAAAASLISVIAFAAQVFDGCVKGFVVLSSARNLERDADVLRSMLDWEQYRLEQWAEQVGLHDPVKADTLADWQLVTDTLNHLENLLNDTTVLKRKYNLVLAEENAVDQKFMKDDGQEKASISRFKRLFSQSDRSSSPAAARVIQAKNSPVRKLWWAAVDKESMKRLIDDIARFVQRLHDSLNTSIQAQMQKSMQSLLQQATDRYSNVPDLEFLRGLAVQLKHQGPSGESHDADDLQREIESKFKRLLFNAIDHGQIDEVVALLDEGVDADAENHYGWSTLIRASESGHLNVVELLLQRGADPSHGTIGHRIPMHFAAEAGHLEVLKILLQQPHADVNYKDDEGQTALLKAARNGKVDVVRFLLEQDGIDINADSKDGFTPLLLAIYDDYKDIVHLLCARPDLNPNLADRTHEQSPIWMAVSSDADMVQALFARKDIDVNGRGPSGETALCRGARQSFNHAIKPLLDAKADCNLKDRRGQTPLSCAAAAGNEAGLDLLLQYPLVQINLTDSTGRTALFRAAEAGHTKCVKLLLAKVASTEIQNQDGQTALSIASSNGHKIPAKMLLKGAANANTQDKNGNTPLALAAQNNHDILVRLLLENGADPELADEDEETPFEKARDKRLDDVLRIFKEVLKL